MPTQRDLVQYQDFVDSPFPPKSESRALLPGGRAAGWTPLPADPAG